MNNILATMCYIDTGSHYLMLKRNKKDNDIHEGLTISVGGKMEGGESPQEGIIREVKEETGLDLKNPKLRGIISFPNFDGKSNWYTYVFTASDYTGQILEDSPEGDLLWIAKEDIKNRKIKTWEGDFIFLDWLIDEKSFFSAKFEYIDKKLKNYSVDFY
ncbi:MULTISPECIES: 8-oxo-dGTP diphosphatase [unclassified Gemella]|uniref:NUDIX hydrolase n=1 Tax=unclassified Gemella TaxID=2624949 RepID=UPI001072EF7B|nr:MULTISPECIES: 8-oxo-dGTP diphosphatase [unclassified Gemella]MBF0709670.1 8-oxo-dGTP diphosphatase [Gemella sp. GL1.1]MBF0746911.1 8-oxo-dGTP diphosphatase [Gemella sp. 19428wG2_WT2a]NYS27014.1 8-oxo-dGTP diphosphatase [Gemella sp. GL1]TFU59137.1 8-oxo-dGTP diphosphatase [Gemella sp. WT2a]